MKKSLINKIQCALTHDIRVCNACKKCGNRVDILNEFMEAVKEKETFRIIHYEGSFGNIKNIISEKEIKAKSIKTINAVKEVFGEGIKKSGYVIATLFADDIAIYDYGSYTKFICVASSKYSLEELRSKLNGKQESIEDYIGKYR